MEPKESLETRKKMAEMHDDVLDRINKAHENKQHIEVCWLCYACFESRVKRIIIKICSGCNKPDKKNGNPVGITTKLRCIENLIKGRYLPLENEDSNLMNEMLKWCEERNRLTHGMVCVENYDNVDKKFAELAEKGKELVKRMYSLGTNVREFYYEASEIPAFDSETLKKCRLKNKCIKENEK